MTYRSDIDGLRALAIVPVIFFHAGFRGFSGGYVGVDVFFVISGFLIASIILADADAGRFSIARFYERRIRRILPALFVVMAASIPPAWLLMAPHQLREFGQSIVAVSVFASNVLFWAQSGYFDSDSSLRPLLHTWSLAVEEQYYLLFPVALLGIWKLGRRWIAFLFLMIAVASLYLSQVAATQAPSANFFFLPTRAWELLIGVLTAMQLTWRGPCQASTVAREAGSVAGLLAVLVSIAVFDARTPFPSLYALVPTLGTAAVIYFSGNGTSVGRILSKPLLVRIGVLSYSLYLWHQPVLAYIKLVRRGEALGFGDYAAYLAITVSLSHATYQYVERPFRRIAIHRTVLFVGAAAVSVLFAAVGFLGQSTNGFLAFKFSNVPDDRRSLLIDVRTERRTAEEVLSSQSAYLDRQSFDAGGRARKVLFFGDSVARDLATAVAVERDQFSGCEFRMLSLSNDCLEPMSRFDKTCRRSLETLPSSRLVRTASLVVVSFLWKDSADAAVIGKLLQSLRDHNSNVLVLGSASFLDMASVSYELTRLEDALTQARIDDVVFNSRRLKFDRGNAVARSLSSSLGLGYFDRNDLYCDNTRRQCRIIVSGAGSVLWDNTHLTSYGMQITAQRVSEVNLLSCGR